jgi:hypothetical protein
MTEQRSDDLKAKREAAALLGLGDVERLSPADTLRCDLIATLRLVIDDAGATVLDGSSTDLARLITATESLIALLPGKALPEPAAPEGGKSDPRQIMLETYLEMRRRGALAGEGLDGLKLTVEKLKAEVVSRDARIGELEAALAGSVPLPPNAVKLRNDNPVRSVAAPAAPPPAPQPPPEQPAYDYNREDGWKSYVEPTGEIRSTPRGRFDV